MCAKRRRESEGLRPSGRFGRQPNVLPGEAMKSKNRSGAEGDNCDSTMQLSAGMNPIEHNMRDAGLLPNVPLHYSA